MNIEPIKKIIFDFGNVIVDLDREGVERRFAEQGVDVNRFLGMSRQSGIFGDLELGRIEPDDWCRELIRLAPQFQLPGRPLTLTVEGIKEAWNAMVAGIPLRRLQALDVLHKRYRLSMLSNTNAIHVDFSFENHFRAQGYEPSELFENIFLSNEMQLCKPDRDIFEETLRRSGYKPEETLFIDDSQENCQAFAQLGVQTFCPKHPDEWLALLCPSVASIGFYDGVHQGHLHLIEQVKTLAAERGLDSLLVTFYEHPRQVLHSDYIPQLLTSPEEKLTLLRQTGVDRIELMHFTSGMSQLTARQFMQQVLHDRLGVKVLVMGYDHHFGHGGGSFEDYQQWGKEIGIEVIRATEKKMESAGDGVSSSAIRRLLIQGDVKGAAALLGHPYTLQGTVVRGHQIGHELGFPTANLQQGTYKLVPCMGVYAVWVELEDGQRYAGMLNIGQRPTVNNGSEQTIEVNLIDFDGNLYGCHVTLHFIDFLRLERRFDSREQLIEQIKLDRQQALKRVKNEE